MTNLVISFKMTSDGARAAGGWLPGPGRQSKNERETPKRTRCGSQLNA